MSKIYEKWVNYTYIKNYDKKVIILIIFFHFSSNILTISPDPFYFKSPIIFMDWFINKNNCFYKLTILIIKWENEKWKMGEFY